MDRVTIKDVSEEAGVSVATVSNAIHSPHVLAPETLERVTATIERLGYTPNRAAVALQKQRTSTIGYRMPPATEGFALDRFLHRLVECAGEADLDIVLFTPRPGQSEVEAYRELIRRGAVDGFVLSGTNHSDPRVSYLTSAGVPFTTFGRTDQPELHNWVDIDGESGIRVAVEHLLELGHERIGLIRWPEGSLTGDERAAGYYAALDAAGIEANPDFVIETVNGIDEGEVATEQLLGRDIPPTAIVCVQDLLALGAIGGVQKAGLAVGQDLSVVGFDDIPSASVFSVGLTSVRQPMDRVGELMISFFLEAVDNSPDMAHLSAMVEPELVVRGSTAPPRGPAS